MKVYVAAITNGIYMFPIAGGKFYKNRKAAENVCVKYNEGKDNNRQKAVVLIADNWHQEFLDLQH